MEAIRKTIQRIVLEEMRSASCLLAHPLDEVLDPSDKSLLNTVTPEKKREIQFKALKISEQLSYTSFETEEIKALKKAVGRDA